jgi:hypothetical protein
MGKWMKVWAGIVLMLVVGLMASVIGAKGLYSEVTAAWVQAIASVAAIIAAGYFASLPLRHAEQARRRERLALIEAVDEAVKAYWTPVSLLSSSVRKRNQLLLLRAVQQRDHAADRALKSLLEMPAASWPSAKLYVAAAQLVRHGDALFATVAQLGVERVRADIFDTLMIPAFHAVKARITIRGQIAADRQVH